MKTLRSHLEGRWQSGSGRPNTLFNPTTEAPVAETSTEGLNFAAAVAYARDTGGPALRGMTFAERGALLGRMAKALHGAREELIALAIENGGNTRSDAKFDIDGASATLAAYAAIGERLGNVRTLADGEAEQIGRTARLSGQHILVPRRGVAVHINAFNFPAWGLAEKAATALLAGMPVISKPATATAVVSHRMVELFVDDNILPPGALSFICGSVGDLLDHLDGQDVLAFTGSSDTAAVLRKQDGAVARSVHVNVEADSLNSAVLCADVSLPSETGQLFLADVVRDLTQKTGQKCTAIRRVFVPADKMDEVAAAITERLDGLVIGNPASEGVRMGPLATANQLRDVRAGIARLAAQTTAVYGGDGAVTPKDVEPGKGYFVGPVVRRADDARAATVVHAHEVFGPVTTLLAYDGTPTMAGELVRLGGGGLVSSIYSDDRDTVAAMVGELASHHGRLYLGSAKMAAQSMGPGTVMPTLLHGGPGRAGGGEELGGERGMRLYQQRVALQGDASVLKTLVG